MKKASTKNELLSLMKLGPATQKDLALLGITTIAQLTHANADALYEHLQKITKKNMIRVFGMYLLQLHMRQIPEKKLLGGIGH